MQAGSKRWVSVTDSEFAHEAEGLAHVRDLLPDRSPFHAWSNFEFIDAYGTWSEVDLLVLSEGCLNLIELKHYQADIKGSATRWQVVTGPNVRSEVSPLETATRKARRLASVLKATAVRIGLPDRAVPFVNASVFLHASGTRCLLAETDKVGLFGLDGNERRSGLPSIADLVLAPPRRFPVNEADVLRIIKEAGFAVRREREVGSWRLIGEPTAEGDGWQDWPAEHRSLRETARIRFNTTAPGASPTDVNAARKLAEREYALTKRLRHPGILAPVDFVEDEIGCGLVFPFNEHDQRLDLWLADHADTLDLRTQVDLVRQLAEAVQYAHSNGVVHRALNPGAVIVHDTSEGPKTLIGGWQVVGSTPDAGSSIPATRGVATQIFGILEARRQSRNSGVSDAYIAPEGQWRPDANRTKLDIFALGALTYLLVTGHDPASSGVQLKQRLEREHGLDLAADLPHTSHHLRDLVLAATNPIVSERLRDATTFVTDLSKVEKDIGETSTITEDDPLEAPPGTVFGERFVLWRRLGSGSTAVGLLVSDLEEPDSDQRVLKVAIDDTAAKRLKGEAEVLVELRKRKTNRIVRIVDPRPLMLGTRTALLLESAGEETLADVLRDRRRLSLDLLERWGTDLLDALVTLDAAGVDHRDIKPSNLGVREQKSDRAKHLVLFDFSLARASASALGAGTPPYLDPFLGTGSRRNWDSAAERYAAAATLFEMATGHTPVYGDGETDPRFLDQPTIDPGEFDPVIADALVEFFTKALAKDVSQRHSTASQILAAWRSALSASTSTTPEDADEVVDRATLSTPLPLSGLTPRALSALEPFRLQTVGDLACLDTSRLSRFTGIVDATKREIRSRAKQWREKYADELAAITPSAPDSQPSMADPFTMPEIAARVLVDAAESKARASAASVILGLEGEVDPFGVLAEYAPALGVGGQPQASTAMSNLRDAWARSQRAVTLLDSVEERVVATIDGLDGATWADAVVAALAPVTADDHDRRVIAGLVRAALDRAEDKAKGADEEPPIGRRRRRRDNRVLLARSVEIADAAMSLGNAADDLVAEAAQARQFVVPRGRSVPVLRRFWGTGLPPLEDVALIRLASRISDTSGSSANGELFPLTMPAADAVRLALGSTSPSQQLTVDQIRRLVQIRFPGVEQIPGRPALDSVMDDAGTQLEWNGHAYAVPSVHSSTTFATGTTTLPGIPIRTSEGKKNPALQPLRDSIATRSFLALGVRPKDADSTTGCLNEAFRAVELNITDALLDALRAQADGFGVPWETVLAADAAPEDSEDARGLRALIVAAMPAVKSQIAESITVAATAGSPVVLTDAAPLARYGQMSVLAHLADITTPRDSAVWLVVPATSASGQTLDGVPIPLSYASQFVSLGGQIVLATEGNPQ